MRSSIAVTHYDLGGGAIVGGSGLQRREQGPGVSIHHSELRGSKCIAPPEADPTGAGDGSVRTALMASGVVQVARARRARWPWDFLSVDRVAELSLIRLGGILSTGQ